MRPHRVILIEDAHVVLTKLGHSSSIREGALDLGTRLRENITRVKKLEHALVEEFVVTGVIRYVEVAALRLGVLAFCSQSARLFTVRQLEHIDEVLVAQVDATLNWQASRDLTPIKRERQLCKRLQVEDMLMVVDPSCAIVVVQVISRVPLALLFLLRGGHQGHLEVLRLATVPRYRL